MSEDQRFLVIGLDGACWPLIDEWIEEGELPNIKELKEEGLWGPLESTKPPITCPAWKCYTTGKNPGKLGVYWWNAINMDEKKIEVAHSGRFNSQQLWDYLNDEGVDTGIVGIPLTYPPDQVDGFMVAGGPDAVDERFYHPDSVKEEIDELDYKLHPDVVFAGDVEEDGEEVRGIEELVKQRFELGKRLNEKHEPDFLQVTTFYLNSPLHHFFYRSPSVKRVWKEIDSQIGELKDEFDYIMLMSDHGTTPISKSTHINAWLKQEGYLEVEKSKTQVLDSMGLTIQNISSVLDTLGIKNLLANSKTLRNIGERIFPSEGVQRGLGGEATLEGVIWEETQAIGLPQSPIYLTVDEDSPEYEDLREELVAKLRKIEDPETGENVFSQASKYEEVYEGSCEGHVPDILAVDHDNYHNRGGLYMDEFFQESEWKGNNGQNGLFLLHGPDIEAEERDAVLYDLLPTILDTMDAEIPEELDGESLR